MGFIDWLLQFSDNESRRTLFTSFVGLAGVVLGGIVSTATAVSIERGRRRREAAFAAIRLTAILDRYIEDCATSATDGGERHSDEYYRNRYPTPDLIFPDEMAWTALPRNLMYAAHRLKVDHDSGEKGLDFVYNEIAFGYEKDEYFTEKRVVYSRLGLAAVEILRLLKDRFDVPLTDRTDYDPRKTFDRLLDERSRLDTERQTRIEQMERERIERGDPPGLFPPI
jgi:hypothetical protein